MSGPDESAPAAGDAIQAEAVVDAVAARLAELDRHDVAEHPRLLESLHGELQAALARSAQPARPEPPGPGYQPGARPGGAPGDGR